jgi:hypothetical protein
MVRTPTGRMDQAPSDSRDEKLVNDRQLDDAVQFLLAGSEHSIEFLRLRNGTRETVQHEPTRLKAGVSGISQGMVVRARGWNNMFKAW